MTFARTCAVGMTLTGASASLVYVAHGRLKILDVQL
jgi:hypothetical protein